MDGSFSITVLRKSWLSNYNLLAQEDYFFFIDLRDHLKCISKDINAIN